MNAQVGFQAVSNNAPIFTVRTEGTCAPALRWKSTFLDQTSTCVFVSLLIRTAVPQRSIMTLFVILDGAVVTDFPSTTSRLYAQTLTLQCTAMGIPLPTLSWLKDELSIITSSPRVTIQVSTTSGSSETTFSTLSILQLTLLDEGEYSCIAVNTLPAGLSQDSTTTVLNVEESL